MRELSGSDATDQLRASVEAFNTKAGEQTYEMVRLTKTMAKLTKVMLALVVVQVVVAVAAIIVAA